MYNAVKKNSFFLIKYALAHFVATFVTFTFDNRIQSLSIYHLGVQIISSCIRFTSIFPKHTAFSDICLLLWPQSSRLCDQTDNRAALL